MRLVLPSLSEIFINGKQYLKYDKNTLMPGKQRQYLDDMIADTCAYLENRVPELKQLRAVEHGEEITLDIIFKNFC